jgi:DNA-directed RNA polymerase specialized sigma24 family protein
VVKAVLVLTLERKGEMTREEFGNMYEQAYGRTVAFLLSSGACATIAVDVVQSLWMRGWERLSQLRDRRFLLTWINTIALNEYRRQMNGVTPRELAYQHGITETAVRVRCLRARRSARAAFERTPPVHKPSYGVEADLPSQICTFKQ